MPLVTASQFNLDPRIGQGLSGGLQTLQRFQQFGQQNLALQREAGVREALGGATEFAPQTEQQQMLAGQTAGFGGEQALAEQPQPIKTQEEKIQIARSIDPAIANRVLKDMGLDDASKRAEMSRFAADLEATPFDMRPEKIRARSENLRAGGRDSTQTDKLLDLDEQAQNKGLLGIQLMDLTTRERLDIQAAQAKVSAKRIEAKDVKSSKILDDGTVITVLKNGETVVTNPSGEELTGEARIQAVRDAQEFGVDVQQRRAKGRGLGKGAGKIALAAFERVGKIRENIADLQKGVDLIEKEGATTGFIQDFLPNMKASTRKLANLRRRLGLNVVGAVTFGALSKGELDLAMDVALPKGISPEETVKWIKARQAAQEKLAINLEDAALYLADHSVAELIQRNRAMAKAGEKKSEAAPAGTQQAGQQQAQPTGKTATNPTTGEKLQELSDGTWRKI